MRAPADNSNTPCPRVSVVSRKRRGQTLILALAILFLLITLGGIFITLLIRNLQRVTRQSETDESLTLALAGLQFSAQQFRSSPEGADWRPEITEVLWRTPQPPVLPPVPLTGPHPADANGSGDLDAAELRTVDPDFEWLDPVRNGGFPFVRVATGRGRFLVRVTYVPTFRPATTGGPADEFDQNSKMIHVEVVGRAGEFDPSDPTSFATDPTRYRQGSIVGPFRKLEAYVPVGLVDQLWWITNFTNERGPARLGIPAMRNPGYDPNQPTNAANNQEYFQHRTLFSGGIRSNADLQFLGTNTIRIYPARGEAVQVTGEITAPQQPNTTSGGVVQAVDDDGQGPPGPNVFPGDIQDDNPLNDSILLSIPLAGSTTPGFTTGQMFNTGGDTRYLVRDEAQRRSDLFGLERSTREMTVPALNRLDSTTGVQHYKALTRDSGVPIQLPTGRVVHTGWYGLTDLALDPRVRAKGLYLPNIDDIQHPENRETVKDEWLQRNKQNPGWFLGRYTPSVRTANSTQLRPITEVILTEVGGVPKIRVIATYPDRAQFNVPGTATTEPGYFYDLAWNPGTPNQGVLANPQQIRDFDYPENGVLFAEGSIRVRGTVGTGAVARQLTIVSGGTIYIEGNIQKARPDSFVALMAQDHVTLNPTAFTRLQVNGDWVPNPAGDGIIMQQNSDIDIEVDDALGLSSAFVHLRHGAMAEDTNSETAIHLFLPRVAPDWPNWQVDRYDFASTNPSTWPAAIRPASPPEPDYSTSPASQLFYWFHQVSQGSPLNWAESSYQTTLNPNEPNYERKSLFVPNVISTNGRSKFRIHVGPKDGDPLAPNQQAYLLSRVAVTPVDRPLQVRVEAMIYAFNGSWFIIPPPFFNQDADDSGADTRGRMANTGARANKTFPRTSGPYPFWNEPLNLEVQVVGAVNENFPADPGDTTAWTSKMWTFAAPSTVGANFDTSYDQTTFPLPATRPAFRPDIHYNYDPNLRRMIRVRKLRTGQEEVAWTAPTPPPAGIRPLAVVLNEALNVDNSYVETLPVLPHLPASAVVYEGNPF